MTHPCNYYSCIENYHGECYGEGCKLNPMPEPGAEDDDNENENTQEDNQ